MPIQAWAHKVIPWKPLFLTIKKKNPLHKFKVSRLMLDDCGSQVANLSSTTQSWLYWNYDMKMFKCGMMTGVTKKYML